MAGQILPPSALRQHVGVVGKTGSGKTSTLKLLVEQAAAEGSRICILDPIKSDWWGLTSSADGKRAGLPFQILGGPHGHVPLHDGAGAAVGQKVADGSLPLSIIDMADFRPGGLQRFFVSFAEALFRNIRGVVYLVIEEAHEFAPKERAGLGDENAAIHWAKKLATGSRSKGIRLMVGTQRIQALHNAVLGSCETLITHRLTLPADQKPVMDWLKANLDKDTATRVAASLSSLKTGCGWICSGEAGITRQVQFPRIATFDNSATPDHDDAAAKVIQAPVDVAALRAIIGRAIEEAEASDPKKLQARIRDLEKQLAKAGTSSGATPAELQAAEKRGYEQGRASGFAQAYADAANDAEHLARKYRSWAQQEAGQDDKAPVERKPIRPPAERHAPVIQPKAAKPAARPVTGLNGPQMKILDAIAWWEAVGIAQPTRIQVAAVAGYSPQGGAFQNPLGSLRSGGFIDYPAGGRVCFTDAGRAAASAPEAAPTEADLHAMVMAILDGPRRKILQPLLEAYPRSLSREDLAAAAGYEPRGGAFQNPLGALRSLGLIDYPERGQVVALPILFIEER